ncbi:hypothetical protein CXB51_019765 [Gossypium anomalum]|nr:hypothetical protein CXB51_019765 [Gossypium anomalum]
MEEYQE